MEGKEITNETSKERYQHTRYWPLAKDNWASVNVLIGITAQVIPFSLLDYVTTVFTMPCVVWLAWFPIQIPPFQGSVVNPIEPQITFAQKTKPSSILCNCRLPWYQVPNELVLLGCPDYSEVPSVLRADISSINSSKGGSIIDVVLPVAKSVPVCGLWTKGTWRSMSSDLRKQRLTLSRPGGRGWGALSEPSQKNLVHDRRQRDNKTSMVWNHIFRTHLTHILLFWS